MAPFYWNIIVVQFVCLCILHQPYLTVSAGTANCSMLWEFGFQSAPPQEGAGFFNVPEDGSLRTQGLYLQHDSNCLSPRSDR